MWTTREKFWSIPWTPEHWPGAGRQRNHEVILNWESEGLAKSRRGRYGSMPLGKKVLAGLPGENRLLPPADSFLLKETVRSLSSARTKFWNPIFARNFLAGLSQSSASHCKRVVRSCLRMVPTPYTTNSIYRSITKIFLTWHVCMLSLFSKDLFYTTWR